MQRNFDLENAGVEGGVNEEVKDDLVDGHRQGKPMNYDINGRCPGRDDPEDDFRSGTENRDGNHRSNSELRSITADHGSVQRSKRGKLDEQDLNRNIRKLPLTWKRTKEASRAQTSKSEAQTRPTITGR